MNFASYSAPGKLMLWGEYAVLEGHPAVALCFDARIRCTAVQSARRGVHFDSPSLLGARNPVFIEELEGPRPKELELLWPLLSEAVVAVDGIALKFHADFPHTWGLGSSSASSLAAVAAVYTVMGTPFTNATLFDRVRRLQRRLQGAASGYDAATQLLGGAVRFVGGDEPVMERLEAPRRPWLVAYTGRKASTGSMISKVRAVYPPGHILYAAVGKLAEQGAKLLVSGSTTEIGAAMNEGHALLRALGGVPDDLHDKVLALQKHDWIHGARMSGAGGGDCVLVLPVDVKRASEAIRAQGWDVLPLTFEETGLREET